MPTKKVQIIDYSIKHAENADTLDGKHASDFGSFDDVAILQGLVGDTAVVDQIAQAIDSSVADWEQYDETQLDYIKNRTHYYKEEKEIMSVSWVGVTEGLEKIPGLDLYKVSDDIFPNISDSTHAFKVKELINGQMVEAIYVNAVQHDDHLQILADPFNKFAYILYEGNQFGCTPGTYLYSTRGIDDNNFRYTLSLSYIEKGYYKTLDEVYIPETIARVNDIIPDTTLNTEGKPADAKKTGDEIRGIKESIGGTSVSEQIAQAVSNHGHEASAITSGQLHTEVLPIVPIAKGGTGATTAEEARANLGITLENLGAADAQITADNFNNLTSLIGDTSVSEQISQAIDNSKSDWEQNDETEADYIKNRTHYVISPESTEVITWDGNIDGLEKIHEENLYKVSDKVPYVASNEFEYHFDITEICNGQEFSYNIKAVNRYDGYAFIFGQNGYAPVCIVYGDNSFGCSIGTYFNLNPECRTLSLTSVRKECVKTLSEKYIPDSIARVNDIIPDTSLTYRGKPADAKATGVAIDGVKSTIKQLTEPVVATLKRELPNDNITFLDVTIEGFQNLYTGFEMTIIPNSNIYNGVCLSVNESNYINVFACRNRGDVGKLPQLSFIKGRPYKLIYDEHTDVSGNLIARWIARDIVITGVEDLQASTSGLSIEKGGTGATTIEEARENLGVLSAQKTADEINNVRILIGDTSVSEQIAKSINDHNNSLFDADNGELLVSKLPIVPITKGGTGATTAEEARANLEITLENLGAADAQTTADEINNVRNLIGTTSVSEQITQAIDEHNESLFDSDSGELLVEVLPIVPITKGGTGAATAEEARANLEITLENLGAADAKITADEINNVRNLIGDISVSEQISQAITEHNNSLFDADNGELLVSKLPIAPIEKGGTGAITAEDARANLEITPENIGAADAKTTADNFDVVMGLIGTVSVAEQINNAVSQKSAVQFITWEEND